MAQSIYRSINGRHNFAGRSMTQPTPNPRTSQPMVKQPIVKQPWLGLLLAAGAIALGLAAMATYRQATSSWGTGSAAPEKPAAEFESAAASPGGAPMGNGAPIPVGINLSGVNDWSTQWPFVDVFKASRPWISQRQGTAWGEGGPVKLTAQGWVAALEPGQLVETIVMMDRRFPAGNYTLLYEGEGDISFVFDNAKIISREPGKLVVQVRPNEVGIFMRLKGINPNNPLRNIRFIMPGFETTYQTQPFHPLFLQRLKPFQVIRFMDWGGTNHSKQREWSDRPTVDRPTQATGVALDYQIQLANTLKINPWFTLPAEASDDYVRQFATMVRDRLDPSLKVHVEYS
jgi:hypothetical protein